MSDAWKGSMPKLGLSLRDENRDLRAALERSDAREAESGIAKNTLRAEIASLREKLAERDAGIAEAVKELRREDPGSIAYALRLANEYLDGPTPAHELADRLDALAKVRGTQNEWNLGDASPKRTD